MSATMLPESSCGAAPIAAETITGRSAQRSAPLLLLKPARAINS
jgi:hypothetical protein